MVRRTLGIGLAAALALSLPMPATGTGQACDNEPLPDAPTVKVLVMGDSLSHGFSGDYTWRYRFWQAERAKGVNIDFVGPIESLLRTWDVADPNNELYADPCFVERQHWAIGGKDLAATLEPTPWDSTRSEVAWATGYYQPDVVLGFMGYNDLKPKDPVTGRHGFTPGDLIDNAKLFVDQVRAAKPGTPVAMATIALTKAPQVVVEGASYNTQLATAVDGWTTPAEPVGLIDVMADWKGTPLDTWDGYHPNANGEMHLAWDVADGLHALDLVPALDRPIPVQPLGPVAPATLSVTGGTPSSVNLSWVFPTGADRAFVYQRDLTLGTPAEKVPPGPDRFAVAASVTGLAEHRYAFTVRVAKGTAVSEQPSNEVVVDLRPFGQVGTPTVSAEHHAATVNWSVAAGADRYRVRWSREGSSSWSTISTTATSYRRSGLAAGARYSFDVTPIRDNLSGVRSPAVTRTVLGTVNAAVPRPRISAVATHRFRVSWHRASDATHYQVRVKPTGGRWRTLGWSRSTTFVAPRLTKGRNYWVAVVAWDSYIAGRASPAARVKGR